MQPVRRTSCGSPHPRRTGALLTAELLFVLPIFGVLLAGMVELGLLVQGRNVVQLAAIEGARAASLHYPDVEQRNQAILAAVRQVLGKQEWKDAAVVLFAGSDVSGEPVTVIVQLPMHIVAPDLLGPVGISIQGRLLVAQATMTKH